MTLTYINVICRTYKAFESLLVRIAGVCLCCSVLQYFAQRIAEVFTTQQTQALPTP